MMTKIVFSPTNEVSRKVPPIPLKKAIPDWYRDMDLLMEGRKITALTSEPTPFTIKACVPVQDYLTSGYLLRTQEETMFTKYAEGDTEGFGWRNPSDHRTIATHPHGQCPVQIDGKKKHYVKFAPGWIIKTPPGYSCLFYQPPLFMEKRFHLFPAIVDTDTFDHTIEFPGYLGDFEATIRIPPETPLIAVFPFKRDNWESVVEETITDPTKSSFWFNRQTWLFDIYRDVFHERKSYK